MIKLNLVVTLALLVYTSITNAQDQQTPDVKYRRSSLHTMILESGNFDRKDVVLKAFNESPFPDKYNDHTIGEKSFDPSKYGLTDAEKAIIYKDKAGKESEAKELPFKIQKYFNENQIGNKLVAKWFDRTADGSFNWNTVADRGLVSASYLDTKTAEASSDGIAILKTAGFELIGNTFVVVNKFNFVSNEVAAAATRDAAKIAANAIKVAALKEAAIKAADLAYEKGKEGYSIWATAYLYKLVWNDSVSAVFFTDLYMEKDAVDPAKKAAFDNSNLFQLEFIGDESASSLVTFSLKEKRTEDQIVTVGTIRTIDAVFAKLQKKYDVFKTKTPLFTGNPITAKIGLKEGLEGGDKFEVLEQVIDQKTGNVKYVSKGTVTVDKNAIWDNRYDAAGDAPAEEADAKPAIDRTTFKGGKNYYPGMLLRQVK